MKKIEGVRKKGRKWAAYAVIGGQLRRIGLFDTEDRAARSIEDVKAYYYDENPFEYTNLEEWKDAT